MVLRLGAIAIALLPVVLGVLLHDLHGAAWLGAALALVGGVVFTLVRPRVRALVLLGTLLAAFAGLVAARIPAVFADAPVIDLRTASMPPDLTGSMVVTGFPREEWILAEYAVPEGALPQQDAPAEAVLVPFLGVEDGPVPLRGAVVVVRVRPGDERAVGPQTLRGRARPLEDELLSAFVQASAVRAPADLRGVLVDTIDERPTPVWLELVLVLLATLGALVCLWIAGTGREQPAAAHLRAARRVR